MMGKTANIDLTRHRLPNTLFRLSTKTRRVAPIGFLENLAGAVAVERMLGQCVRVPFAAVGGEEIAAVDMDRGGELGRRIGDRMDDVIAKWLGLPDGDRARTGRLELVLARLSYSAPEDVVLRPPYTPMTAHM